MESVTVHWSGKPENHFKIIGDDSNRCYATFLQLKNVEIWIDRRERNSCKLLETFSQKIRRRTKELFS